MHTPNPKSKPRPRFIRNRQAGAALVIAMFTLLLVSAVALSLVMASGTESSLAGNYRSSTSAYYAGLAGVEEARGRLLPSNPNFFNNAIPNFITVAGVAPVLTITAGVPQVRYIINAQPNEVVDPANQGNQYADKEYKNEWGGANPPAVGAGTQYINSVFTTPNTQTADPGAAQGPMFKWVRITPATEQSLGIDVNGSGGTPDNTTPILYDSGAANATGQAGSLTLVPSANTDEVFQITADAVMPNGSQKLMQYVVAPVTFGLNFPSALTLSGNISQFQGANSAPYKVNGTDGSGTPPNTVPGCTPNANNSLPAIGVTDAPPATTDKTTVTSGIPRPGNYTGGGLSTPSVGEVSLNPLLANASGLDQLVQTITNNADMVLTPPAGTAASYSQLPPSTIASPCTPSTVVVQGDFDLGPATGCGLLVVTGNFLYHGNSGWDGIILVIGTGTTQFVGQGGGSGQFDGAVFVASTSTPANVSFNISGGGGNGIYYNSCWIQNSQKPPTLRVVSFRELANPN